nr:chromosomal replication initiator protein DnaA [bacterium]
QEIVSNEFEIPSDLLRSKTRKREIVEARQVAMYLCTEFTTLTLKAIGLQFGGRDHATVIHSRESICEKLKVNDKLEELMNRLRRKIELASL